MSQINRQVAVQFGEEEMHIGRRRRVANQPAGGSAVWGR